MLVTILASGLLAGCALVQPLPETTGLDERLAAMPTGGLPLAGPVTIRWDEHQIPYIEADDDGDAAFALGLVHAHLRLGQMAIFKRIAQGRIAEMGGPLAIDIDHGVRMLDFGRAATAMKEQMPADTRRWMDRFVAGINHYQATAQVLPHEYRVLGLEPEPWIVEDILTFGRLAGTDVTWLVWFNLLELRQRQDWPEIWARLIRKQGDGLAGGDGAGRASALAQILSGLSRSGSNSLAVGPTRTGTGGALIANDPHLGLNVPNTWIIAGLKSPSYHAVGLMVPGLPFFAIGRNPWIAWGGTNMRASASDLIDVSDLPPSAISQRNETIKVRWWPDREVPIRETPLGPIISDVPQLAELDLPPLALRWTGHRPSDEVSAMLQVSRARTFEEFRAAFTNFSVPGQNMLYADTSGHIGKVLAVRVPDRNGSPPSDLVVRAEDSEPTWARLRGIEDLPFSFDPAAAYLVSANNRPATADARVGYFFSPEDRVERMAALIEGAAAPIGFETLRALQQDVYVGSSDALRRRLVASIEQLDLADTASAGEREVIRLLASWDGHYRPDAQGPVVFEIFRFAFTRDFYQSQFGETDWAAFANVGQIKDLLLDDMDRADPATLAPLLARALRHTAERYQDYANWGEMHRLALGHPLRFLPLLGSRYRFAEHPIGGSTDALMKTAHASTDTRHTARYGANARHISDLSGLDRNYFVILGGQDGWLGSSTFLDQVPLWLDGRYVEMPLSADRVAERFPRRMELSR
jgi:penicillin amidase